MKNSSFFDDVLIIKDKVFSDDRGFFSEIYSTKQFKELGLGNLFIQENISFSKKRGIIRGLHFQKGDHSQGKLLRVLDGKIQDVFIDLRKKSNSYEQVGMEILSPSDGWIYIPNGFAHGFCTLTDNVSVLYKVDKYYSQENDAGIIWNDKFFNIDWMINDDEVILSKKDINLAPWNEIKDTVEF